MIGLANPQSGFTYAIATEPFDGWVKIGRSANDPRSRLKSCQTGNARKLRLRVTWSMDVEWFLHQHFAEFRGEGEWFALPSALVADMVRWRKEPEPWRRLTAKWDVGRVWAEARLNRNSGVEKLAQVFASKVANGHGRLSWYAECSTWRLSDLERDRLTSGAGLEIEHRGEVLSVRVLAPAVSIGSKSGSGIL